MSPIKREVVIGDCRLLLGDCLEILPTLGKVDAVVTDPPYKLSQEYGSGADADNLVAVSAIWPVSGEMLRVVNDGGVCVMYYDTRILPLALDSMRRAGWRYLRNLTFYRRWGNASVVHGWMSTSDFILIFAKPGAKPQFHGKTAHDVFIRDKPEPDNAGHPAQKPVVDLMSLIARITPDGGAVLDPFMGSGSTGVAAVLAGRGFTGVEVNEAYFETACRRVRSAYETSVRLDGSAQTELIQQPLFSGAAA